MKRIKSCLLFLLAAALLLSFSGCTPEQPTSTPTLTLYVQSEQQGVADDVFADLLKQAGNVKTEILFPAGRFEFQKDHTVGSNVTLTLARGCSLAVAAGKTLTITGTVNAPATYIFPGDGTIAGDIQGTAYVQWFGADEVVDRNHTESFQKALDCCRTVTVPNRADPYGITQLYVNKPLSLIGTGANRVRLDVLKEQGNVFTIASSDVRVENIHFYNVRTEQIEDVTVYLDNSQRNLNNISLYNVHMSKPSRAIADAQSDRYVITNLTLDHMKIGDNRNVGIHLTDCTTGILLNDVTVSSFSPNVITQGFIFENVEQMHLENVDNLGGFAKSGEGSGDGMIFRNCKNVTSYRIMIDYVHGRQLVIENCSNFRLSNYVTSLLNAEGIYIDGLTDSQLDLFKANGAYPASGPAVYLKRCNGVTFNDLIVTYSGNEGVVLENCHNNTFNNLVTSNPAPPYALREQADCSNNVFNGVILSDAFTLQGSGSVINALRTEQGKLFDRVTAPAQG